jgi:hypothetical protein
LTEESKTLKTLLETGELLDDSIVGLKNDIIKQVKKLIDEHELQFLYALDKGDSLEFVFANQISFVFLTRLDQDINPISIDIRGFGTSNILGASITKRVIVVLNFK